MTWGESLQCRMAWVGVSQCPNGGWRKRQGTQQESVDSKGDPVRKINGRCKNGSATYGIVDVAPTPWWCPFLI